jgi:hypothetical protein
MAASTRGDKPTIFIAKLRFMKFLKETGPMEPPFKPHQKNDFALALVHEVIHLQSPTVDPENRELRAAEESRVWREVRVRTCR